MTDTDYDTPAGRFAAAPRPLDFIRIRLHRGGQAEYIKSLFEEELADLYDDLKELRTKGKREDDPAVQECITNARHIIRALKDVSNGLIELIGPDGL